ncbi:MAG: hypothetical protein LV481_05195 [Methylacidiphilales bacterium]|nr:hypothetical protein [Candidatus Methylacidiphilales bacterium]
MKNLPRITLTLGAVMILASANAWAASYSTPVYMKITSPEHPTTWTSGALQQSRVLRWDSSRQMLVADVKYSSKFYEDSANPGQTDDHQVAFPNVRLAANGTDLIASKHGESVIIGRVERTFLGQNIVLNKGVDFNVHRESGKIYASLIYNALMQ